MKKQTLFLLTSVLAVACSLQAQPMMRGNGPKFTGSMAKLFGDNSSFTANVENQIDSASAQAMTMPGKLAFDSGKSRFEMNLADAKGGQMQGAAEHMKAMGMDRMVMISRPDKKLTYQVYPGMTAYVESPLEDPDATKPESAFKIETTELGKETLDGHPCVKNKVVVTDDEGKKHEST